MITVMSRGEYFLEKKPMLLTLIDGEETERKSTGYHFILTKEKGDIFFVPEEKSKTTKDMVLGRFRLYKVINDQNFKEGTYLELSGTSGKWKCYVLPHGLPDKNVSEKSIIATNKCITKVFVRN